MASSAIPAISASALPWVNVLDFAAIADDFTDCTAAFNAAIAAAGPQGTVYVPPGKYVVNGQIEMNGGTGGTAVPWPSKLIGAGSKLSAIHVTPSAIGVQSVGTINATRGVTISDLRFIYDQPLNNNDYTGFSPNFYQYLPVIFVTQGTFAGWDGLTRGGRYERLRIECAWDGISLVGNISYPGFGGEVIEDIESSCLNRTFSVDASTDTIYITRMRVRTYGMTTNQATAFQLPGHAVGLYIGHADGVKVINSIFACGTGVDLHPGADSSGCNAQFVECIFDTQATIYIASGAATGSTSFTECLISSGTHGGTQPGINHHGNPLQVTGCYFYWNALWGSPTPSAAIATAATADMAIISNCYFFMQSNDQNAINHSGLSLQVDNCAFDRSDGGHAYTRSFIAVSGSGRAIIRGNSCQDIVTGSGVFLNLTSTNPNHVVEGNIAPGWTISWPSGTAVQAFGNQTGVMGASGQNQYVSCKQLSLEGGTSNNLKILSGSGSPAGVVTADPGSLYLNTSGSVYVKQTGTGSGGWSAALS